MSIRLSFKQAAGFCATALLCAGLLAGGAPQAAADTNTDAIGALKNLGNAFADITDSTSPAVVFIRIEKKMGHRGMRFPGQGGEIPNDLFERFFGMPGHPGGPRGRGGAEPPAENDVPVPVGQGSGFIISADGHIITNHHVVNDADKIMVQLEDGREFEAEVVGSDEDTEVAVIKIDAEGLPTLRLGDSDNLRVGEWVLAIGNPFGLSHSVTAGIVSARGRGRVGLGNGNFYADFIQTDAAINPGNSGGPLINLDGEVVGLNTAILSRSGGYMGIGFAIPINMVKYVTDQLMENGEVVRGFLGISIQDLDAITSQYFDGVDQGVLVAGVIDDTPAAKAGLLRDDVIVELNGKPATNAGTFKSRVSIIAPGDTANLVIIRDGKKITKKVTIAARPTNLGSSGGGQTGVSKSKSIGVTVQNLTEDLAERFEFESTEGVVITKVTPNSPAARAGLRPGMLIQEVNRQTITNTDDFNAALEDQEEAKSILLLVTEGEYSRYIPLKMK